MTSFILNTNLPEILREIKATSPKGLNIQPIIPAIQTRAAPINFNIDVIINIDINKILIESALIYLVAKCSKTIGKTYFKINGKQISTNDPKAIEMVKKEIDQ
jgi:hypothetical protein